MPTIKPTILTALIPFVVAMNCHSALTVYERDAAITVAPFNLGYTPGSGGGSPGDLVVTSTVLDNSADLNVSGNLFFGPDSFGRMNNGSYAGLQDFKLTGLTVGADLNSSSAVDGDVSPIARVRNEIDTFFLSDQTVEATLFVSYLGHTTNVGADDSVRLFIDRVDAAGDPPVSGGQVFSLGSYVILNGLDDNDDSLTASFTLDAGQRYRIRAVGIADSVISGSESSTLNYLVSIPEPGTAVLAALGAGLLLRRSRRSGQ